MYIVYSVAHGSGAVFDFDTPWLYDFGFILGPSESVMIVPGTEVDDD